MHSATLNRHQYGEHQKQLFDCYKWKKYALQIQSQQWLHFLHEFIHWQCFTLHIDSVASHSVVWIMEIFFPVSCLFIMDDRLGWKIVMVCGRCNLEAGRSWQKSIYEQRWRYLYTIEEINILYYLAVIFLRQKCYHQISNVWCTISPNLYGSGHETVAVLLSGFAINW